MSCIGMKNYVIQLNNDAKPFVTHVDKLKQNIGPAPDDWLKQNTTSYGTETQSTVLPENIAPPLTTSSEPENAIPTHANPTTGMSRPTRLRNKPSWLNDYVTGDVHSSQS